MSKGILLSPNHGLNPTLDMCFWCGQPKGIALCGRLPGDKEAPMNLVTSLEPCDKCAERFKEGVLLIEVSDDSERFHGNEAFAFKDSEGKMHWPTGRYAVMAPGSIKGREAGSKALCDKATMDAIMERTKPQEEKVEEKEDKDEVHG